jgi:hypothetical protein
MSVQWKREQWIKASRKYSNKNKKKCLNCESLVLKRSTRCCSCNSRFIHTGKTLTNAQKKKISKGVTGENNGMWKGNSVGYGGLHKWVRNNKLKPDYCEDCKKCRPYDVANISQEYKRDINDFEWLCRKCHMIKDKRINNLKHQLCQ